MTVSSLIGVSRYRLQPTPAQEAALLKHCAHARFVWNLAVAQHAHWRPGRRSAPGFAEQCRQLTEARAEFEWLRAGSIIVQQQSLKDFAQAMANANADVNAARNIKHAAGHAVSAREGPRIAGPVHREPQRDLLLVG
ncbi:helix-turn-helix domain-containing protein [Nonomuraea sp. B12E4]|uniref:helix-turn-helix domain-containing protein n=1 Tax=Nonomuraea sp. B12E4 TaxID=3153564 RepID=UPI00325F5E7C